MWLLSTAVKTSRAGGPDDLPNWVLREFADILAAPIADILNTSFSECKVPRVWKIANVSPLPKAPTVCDFNKDLRPISLTSTLSKIAESFVIEKSIKPAVLSSIDPNQYGFIPGSSMTFPLIFMLHHWLRATDGTGAAFRTSLVDFRKAFDLVDHQTLNANETVKPRSQADFPELDHRFSTGQTAKGEATWDLLHLAKRHCRSTTGYPARTLAVSRDDQ
ncbi:hypothetical protein ACROYT_G022428 [Oculina patagonica]